MAERFTCFLFHFGGTNDLIIILHSAESMQKKVTITNLFYKTTIQCFRGHFTTKPMPGSMAGLLQVLCVCVGGYEYVWLHWIASYAIWPTFRILAKEVSVCVFHLLESFNKKKEQKKQETDLNVFARNLSICIYFLNL